MRAKSIAVISLAVVATFIRAFWLSETRRSESHGTLPRQRALAAPQPSSAAARQSTSHRPVTPALRPPPLDLAALPSTVRPILGLANESAAVRWKAVEALGRDLTQAERWALYDYLQGHEAETNERMRGVLKNNVILALKNQAQPPPELTQVLLEIFRDKEQDIVIRDYALQHLTTWYEQSQAKAEIQQALWAALEETSEGICGTALLGLHRLAQTDESLDRQWIAAAALRLARDENGSEAVRISALQVCGQMSVKDTLPVALKLAEKADSVPLRISALAAIGYLGGPEQTAFLLQLASGSNPRLQPAIQTALKRLKQRTAG